MLIAQHKTKLKPPYKPKTYITDLPEREERHPASVAEELPQSYPQRMRVAPQFYGEPWGYHITSRAGGRSVCDKIKLLRRVLREDDDRD